MKDSKELAVVKKPRKKRKQTKKKLFKVCEYCGKKFEAKKKTQKFCNLQCSRAGKKNGWPPKVDLVELLSKIKPFLQMGVSIRQSCLNAKVSYDTVIEKKNDKTEETQEFRDGLEAAQNYANMKARQVIVTKIAEGDDYNARWWLQKRDPDFVEKQKVEHEGGVGVTMNWGIPRSPYVNEEEADKKNKD